MRAFKHLILLFFCFPVLSYAEVGVTDQEILIGSSGSLTGPNSESAVAIREGAVKYYEKINAAGGVHGRKINYMTLDDQYDPKKSKENLEDLITKKKVFAIVGGNGGAGIATTLPLIEKEKVPLLFPFAYNDFLYANKKAIFALPASPSVQNRDLMNYVAKDLKQTKFGIFYLDDSSAGAIRDGFTKNLAEYKLQPVRSTSYSRDATDFTRNVDELQKAGVEVVLVGANTTQAIAFVQSAEKKSYKPIYVMTGGVALPQLTVLASKSFGSEPAPLPIHDDWAIMKEFKKDVTGVNPKNEGRAFYGYLGAKLFVEGLKKAGKDLTREKLIAAVESMTDTDIGGIKVSLSKTNHVAMSKGFLYQIENGKIKSLTK